MQRDIQKKYKCAKWELDFYNLSKTLKIELPSVEPKILTQREMELEAQYPGASQDILHFTFEEVQISPKLEHETKSFVDDFNLEFIYNVSVSSEQAVEKYLSDFQSEFSTLIELWPFFQKRVVKTNWDTINLVISFSATAIRIENIIKMVKLNEKWRQNPKSRSKFEDKIILSNLAEFDWSRGNPKFVKGFVAVCSVILGALVLKKWKK